MPPKASITITLQEDMLVATTLAGNVVLRSGEVDMPGHQLKNAVTQELGHASFLMVTPEAEQLVAGATGIAEQFAALAAARRRAAERKHPYVHRCRGSPVWRTRRFGHVSIDADGSISTDLIKCPMGGPREKILYDLGAGVLDAFDACVEFISVFEPLAERRRSRSPTRAYARLAAAAQRVQDWLR